MKKIPQLPNVPIAAQNRECGNSEFPQSKDHGDRSLVDIWGHWYPLWWGSLFCTVIQFPTYSERHLWRACTMSLTVVPGPLACITKEATKGNRIATLCSQLLASSYGAARASFFILAFKFLGSPPSDFYRTTPWTSFIPHLG
jgi:hypothetical protein